MNNEFPDWRVSIILIGFKNPDDILTCLQALAASTYRNFSLVISENGPGDAFGTLCAALAQSGLARDGKPHADGSWRAKLFSDERALEIIASPDNPGYAGGINRCLERVGEADAIWILNPDTEPQPQALEALVRHAAAGGYGIVGGRLVNPVSGRVQLYGGRWRRLMARGFNIGLGAPATATPDIAAVEAQMDYVNGACMLVTRAFLTAIGPMRDDYFLYCEEVDWCLRRGQFRLGYAHDCLIFHAHGSTIGSSTSRQGRSRLSVYLDERNKLLLTRRLFPKLFPFTAVIALVLNAQYLQHRAWKNFFVALEGWWAGLRGETGKPGWFVAARK